MDPRSWRAVAGSDRPIAVWAPVLAWAGLIFVLSAQPDLRILPDEGLDFVVRKVGHAGVFGILALLLWRGVATTARSRPWIWALALTLLYAITDELHQGAVVGRHASAIDVTIDALGALAAVAVVALRAGRREGSARGRLARVAPPSSARIATGTGCEIRALD